MRTWSLQHPRYGLIEVIEGIDQELELIDPGWPTLYSPAHSSLDSSSEASPDPTPDSAPDPTPDRLGDRISDTSTMETDATTDETTHAETSASESSDTEFTRSLTFKSLEESHKLLDEPSTVERRARSLHLVMTKIERLHAPKKLKELLLNKVENLAIRAEQNIGMRVLVRKDDQVFSRFSQVGHHYVALDGPQVMDFQFNTPGLHRGKPRIEPQASSWGELSTVFVQEIGHTVMMDPPKNTWAGRRFAAMEASPWKRVVYPVVAGMGKVGNAIAVLVLWPIVYTLLKHFFAWIGSFFPDIHWPHINWPDIHWPQIPWPHLSLPDLPELPPWLQWVVEHPKLWVPIALGLLTGVIAAIRAAQSRRERRRWKDAELSESTRSEPACAQHPRLDGDRCEHPRLDDRDANMGGQS